MFIWKVRLRQTAIWMILVNSDNWWSSYFRRCVLSTTRVAHLLCCVVSGHAQLNHDPAWNFQLSFTYGRGIMKCEMANWFYSLHLKCSLRKPDCVPRPVQCGYLLSQTKKIQILLQINTATDITLILYLSILYLFTFTFAWRQQWCINICVCCKISCHKILHTFVIIKLSNNHK